jgi:hypothetical protein
MKFTDINIDNDIIIGPYANKKMALCSASKKPIRFQIPRMYMPFGLSGFTPEVGNTKWNIDFSMKGHDEDGNYVNKYFNFIRNFETKVVNNIVENSEQIFGVAMSENSIRSMLNSNIKETIGREPKFRVKVDVDSSDTIKPKIFDANEVDITDTAEKGLYSRHSGVAIVEPVSVYFLNKMFGITWKVVQMKIFEPQRLKGFHMITDDSDTVSGFQFQMDEIEYPKPMSGFQFKLD